MPALAGANVIYGLGMEEMGVNFNLPQLLIDADIADMILYSIQGMPVSDETLAVDVIDSVGYRKDFLTHRHTFKNRHIQSDPRLMDRQVRSRWEAGGSTTMAERAQKLFLKLYDEYQPAPLAPEAAAAVRRIVNEAEASYGLPPSNE